MNVANKNKYITLDTLVQQLYSEYGFIEKGWIGELPSWVLGCFRDLNNSALFPKEFTKLTIKNYSAELPCGFETVEYIKYNGDYMIHVDYDPSAETTRSNTVFKDCIYYCRNNRIKVPFEAGEVEVQYWATTDGKITIPTLAPVLKFVKLTIIKYLLLRGETHVLLTYRDVVNELREAKLEATNSFAMDSMHQVDSFSSYLYPSSVR
jgi:hypothetical protein